METEVAPEADVASAEEAASAERNSVGAIDMAPTKAAMATRRTLLIVRCPLFYALVIPLPN